MSKILFLMIMMAFSQLTFASENEEQAVKHLEVPQVTNAIEAQKIMAEKTAEMQRFENLDAQALHDIHYITYTLEQAVAFYVRELKGEQQKAALELAVVVEDIHINSENNRVERTRQELDRYFKLAALFIADLD